jgi:hypothetical protein
MSIKLLGIINVVSVITDLLWIRFSTFSRYYRKKWDHNGMVHQLFIDFKKAYDSVKREVLYYILLEFVIPKKLARLIKLCLSETYRKVHVGIVLSDKFPVQNSLKEGDALSPLLFNSALEYATKKIKSVWNRMGHISYWLMLMICICWGIV